MSLQPGAECNNSYDHTVGSTVYYVGNHNYAYIQEHFHFQYQGEEHVKNKDV